MAATWPIVSRRPRLDNMDEIYDAIDDRIDFLGTTWNAVSGSADPGGPFKGSLRDLKQYRDAIEGLAASFYDPAEIVGGFDKYTFASVATDAFGANDWRQGDPPRRPHVNDLNDMKAILELLIYLEVSKQGWLISAVRSKRVEIESSVGATYESAWDDAQANSNPVASTNWGVGLIANISGAAKKVMFEAALHEITLPGMGDPSLDSLKLHFLRQLVRNNNAHEDPNLKIEGSDSQPSIVAGNWATMTQLGEMGGLAVIGVGTFYDDVYVDVSPAKQFLRYYINGWRLADNPLGETVSARTESGGLEPTLLGGYGFDPF